MKKYIAKTNVSVNVILPSGKNKHISFSALTGGGSVYYTDSADEQAALEGHYKYGKLFKADEETITPRKAPKKAIEPVVPEKEAEPVAPEKEAEPVAPDDDIVAEAVPEEDASEAVPEETTTDVVSGIELNEEVVEDTFDEIGDTSELPNLHAKVKVVTDFEDARNWLSETYGVSRTKIRSLKAVKEFAASVGVELQGI